MTVIAHWIDNKIAPGSSGNSAPVTNLRPAPSLAVSRSPACKTHAPLSTQLLLRFPIGATVRSQSEPQSSSRSANCSMPASTNSPR